MNCQPIRAAVIAALLISASFTDAHSAEPSTRFQINAKPLAEALMEFGTQAGKVVVAPSSLTTGKTATPIRGEMSPVQALHQLLNGTGLTYQYIDDETVSIVPIATAPAVTRATDTSVGANGSSFSALGENVSAKQTHEGSKGFWQRLRLAQAETSSRSSASNKNSSSEPSTEGSESRGIIQEIVVTARKRAESVQDVPISMAVVTADDIDRRGLVNAEDYLRGIPGVNQVGGAGALGGAAIIIRGMETTSANQNFGAGPTTATYFGETPTTNSAGLSSGSNIDIKLVDIERVEVVRGPQGTSFGSSSLGGLVRTIPVAPKVDGLEARIALGYSTTSGTGGDNYNVQAVGNIPLIQDKLAIRAVAYQYEDSGFYRNRAASDAAFQAFVAATGTEAFATDEDEVGAYSVVGGRIAALFQASDNLKFTLNYLRQDSETDGFLLATSGTYEQAALQVAPEHARRGKTGGVVEYAIDIANAVMEADFGWAELLATYSHVKGESLYVAPGQVINVRWAASVDRPQDHRANVGEIRLATKFDGAWNFLAGLYVEDLDDEYASELIWFGDPATSLVPGQRFLFDYLNRRDLQQKAAFGEVSWQFLPRLTLTGGIRAYEYDRTIRIDQDGPIAGPDSSVNTKTSDENFRANLSYKPDERTLLYAGWTQGFRLGRPQAAVPTRCDANGDGIIDDTNVPIDSTGEVAPDTVDSYEFGGKFALLDRRLTIDVAVFRMDWSDIPVTAIPPCQFSYLANAGKAQSEGVEFQVNLRLSEALRVDFGGSYVDARITEDAPSLGASAGARLPSPKTNANLGLQYEFDVAGHAAFVRADSIYVGDFYSSPATGLREVPTARAGDYIKVDASARIAIESINVDLFVHNLTNEDAYTHRGGAAAFYGQA